MCNVHPNFSLKNLGKKVCIIHGKIRYPNSWHMIELGNSMAQDTSHQCCTSRRALSVDSLCADILGMLPFQAFGRVPGVTKVVSFLNQSVMADWQPCWLTWVTLFCFIYFMLSWWDQCHFISPGLHASTLTTNVVPGTVLCAPKIGGGRQSWVDPLPWPLFPHPPSWFRPFPGLLLSLPASCLPQPTQSHTQFQINVSKAQVLSSLLPLAKAL